MDHYCVEEWMPADVSPDVPGESDICPGHPGKGVDESGVMTTDLPSVGTPEKEHATGMDSDIESLISVLEGTIVSVEGGWSTSDVLEHSTGVDDKVGTDGTDVARLGRGDEADTTATTVEVARRSYTTVDNVRGKLQDQPEVTGTGMNTVVETVDGGDDLEQHAVITTAAVVGTVGTSVARVERGCTTDTADRAARRCSTTAHTVDKVRGTHSDKPDDTRAGGMTLTN